MEKASTTVSALFSTMRSDDAPLILIKEAVETPLGSFLLIADGNGRLRAADFADVESRLSTLLDRRLGKRAYTIAVGIVPRQIKLALSKYFAGDITAIDSIIVSTSGTAFQESVWTGLRSIRPGSPLTYTDFATRLGKIGSGRAVGHANGANPISIIVPCHRLVGASGALTGYSGGIERKRWLLDHEARFASC